MEGKQIAFEKPEVENFKTKLRQAQAFLIDNKVENAKIEIRSVYLGEGEKHFSKTKQIAVYIRLPFEKKAQADELRERLDYNFELGEIIELECAPGEGDQFQDTKNIDKLNGEKGVTISHTPGTVLLVHFWASWCGPALTLTGQYKEMLSKNQKNWEEKVKLIAISMDEDSNRSLAKIKERDWEGLDHYILPGSWEHHVPELYGFKGIPFILLINGQGRIEYAGHPSDLDIEAGINQIIEKLKQNTQEQSESKGQIEEKKIPDLLETEKTKLIGLKVRENGVPDEIYRKLRGLIQKGSFDEIFDLQGIPGFHELYIVLQHTKAFDKDFKLREIARRELVVGGVAGSAAFARLKSKLAEVTKGIPSEFVINKIKVVPSITIVPGDICVMCSKSIKQGPQYLSYHDKLYFCKACGDQIDTSKIGTQKFINPHALIYLTPQESSHPEEVFVERIRDQSQPKTEEEEGNLRNHKGYYCNVCRKGIGEKARYKCLNCLDVEICDACLQEIEANGLPSNKSFKNMRHNTSTHLLQRYVFIESSPL